MIKTDDQATGAKQCSLYELAHMYYVLDMSQQEISKRTFLSRPYISRLLKRAREEGVVEIKLKFIAGRCHYTETALKAEFGLRDVHVYNCRDLEAGERQETICRHSAGLLQDMLHAGQVVGITRGRIISEVMKWLRPERKLDLRVIQLMGGEADSGTHSGPDLIRKMVDLFGGTTSYIDAPLYVENDYVHDHLVREPILRKKLNEASKAGMILTSVPRLSRGMRNHIWSGFIPDKTIDGMIDAGGVGYILGRVFDINGQLIDHPVNRRIIGLGPNELRRMSVVGVCHGEEYAASLLGALRGGFIKTLVTDLSCADAVLSAMAR